MISFCQYLIYLPSWENGSHSLTISPALLSPQILSLGAEGFISQLRHCSPHIKICTCSLNDSLSLIVLKRASKASDGGNFFLVFKHWWAHRYCRLQWGAEKCGRGTSTSVYKEIEWEAVKRTPWVANVFQLECKRRVILCKPSKHVAINVEHLD